MMRWVWSRVVLTALLGAVPGMLPAQSGVHVLVVTGLSGEAAAAQRFRESALPIVTSARTAWGVPDSSLLWLAEDSTLDPRVTGRATREAIEAGIRRLADRAAAGDLVLIVLIGHGSGEGVESKINVPGADPTAGDYAIWLSRLAAQRVVFIVAASGSGDFVAPLAGKDRVVITATKTALERNESIFSLWIARGLTDPAADTDKDGAISMLEAFLFAKAQVEKVYVDTKRLQTEHPLLDDNGDGKGSELPVARGEAVDGLLAARVTVGGPGATDPRAATLVAERVVLERELESLRERKGFLPADVYERELERLLVAIAEKTAAIRALTGTPP